MKKFSNIKILLGPSSFGALDNTPLKMLEEAGFDVVDNPFKRRLTKPEVMDLLKEDIQGLIAGLEPLDREVMTQSSLQVISRCGAGMSNVDVPAAKDSNILVRSTPDAPTESVAELTLGALLSLLRFIPDMNQDLHTKKWTKKIGFQLQGKTVLIIGYGRIGRRFAELLQPFGVTILAADPFVKEVGVGVTLKKIEEALPEADIVSLHCGGEECVLPAEKIRLIKKGAYLLNAARGAVVNEKAVCDALDAGQLAGVWMDAFVDEPYDGPLTAYPQALLTPHVGSYTREGRLNMEKQTVLNLIDAFENLL